jgi:hypothetical protein
MKKFYIVILCLVATWVIATGHAQNTTGDILGTLTDASGNTVASATVTVTNTGTNVARTVASSATGEFAVSLLQPGTYKVAVSAPGYQEFTVSGIQLSAGDRRRVDAKLSVGQVSQTVQVEAEASALQTDSSAVSTTITQVAVQNAPLNGRNFVSLIQVQPGINVGPPNSLTNGTRPLDRRQTSAFSANGQGENQNNAMIDGADNNTKGTQDIPVRPALDAISEMHVQTNNYTADVARTAGAVVDVITKAGTNEFHGDAFEYLRNDITDATSYSFGASLPKSKLRWNQFGGSLGGPIVKNKAFFFGGYEGYRQRASRATTINTVPTLYEQQHPGDFTDLCPTVGTPCPGGPLLTPAQIDPAGMAYFKMYPAPNHGTNQFYAVPSTLQNSDDFDVRSDWHLTQGDQLFARFIYNKAYTELKSGLPEVTVAGKTFDPIGDSAPNLNYNAMLGYTHIFSQNLLLNAAANYTRSDNQDVALSSGVNPNQAFGQPNVNVPAGDITALATISVTGGTLLGNSTFIPVKHKENAFHYFGSVVYTRGAHTMQFGATLIRRQVNTVQSSFPAGNWVFNGYPKLLQGSYLTTQRSLDLVPPNFRLWETGGYAEDNWRATHNLTVNLGLRYDVYTPYTEKDNIISTFDPATGNLLVAGQNGVSNTGGVHTDFHGLQPRVGMALSLANGLVIRGGYGISYFPDNTASIADMKNPPFISSLSTCGVDTTSTVKCPTGMTRFADGFLPPVPTQPTDPAFTIPDATDPHFRTAWAQQTNLTVQKALAGNVVTLSYLGLFGRNLIQTFNDFNAPPPNTATGAAFQALRPYYPVKSNLQTVQLIQSNGISNYNALQGSFERRFSKGLALQVNYTFAQNLTNAISASTATAGGYGLVPSKVNTLDYGNSGIAVRHILNGMINYALPFGQHAGGLEAGFIKGWQLNVLGAWSTSLPFTVVNPSNVSNTVPGTGDRVDVIGSPHLTNKSISAFFDPGAFASQAKGTLGTESLMQYWGPHYRHLDVGLTKMFSLTEHLKLDFTVQSFNLFNTPNFANPNATLPSVTAPDTPVVTLANINNTAVNRNHFGQITSMLTSYNPRVFQFALTLHF